MGARSWYMGSVKKKRTTHPRAVRQRESGKTRSLVKAFSMVSVVARSLVEKSASGNGQEVGNVE